MVKNISDALQKVKDHYDQFIPASTILLLCQVAGHQFRRRMLGPVETFYLLLVQILHGNTACSHLRHLTGVTCSVSAYCRACGGLPSLVPGPPDAPPAVPAFPQVAAACRSLQVFRALARPRESKKRLPARHRRKTFLARAAASSG